MTEIRFNYGDKFTQTSDSNTGIGSTNPAGKLDVAGGTSAGSLRVSGIATLSSYQGFVNTKLSTTENLIVEAGQSGSVSGEVVIGTGQTISVSTGATTGQGGIQSLKVYETFMPPVGGTADRPTDVKPGMVYYNKDFKTIEFWDGNFWKQVDNTFAAGRAALFGGNHNPASAAITAIGAFNIPSGGNETLFGDLTTGSNAGSGVGSRTRGINSSGISPVTDTLTYVTMPSLGNSIVFGDLASVAYRHGGAASSSTRGLFLGGRGAPGGCHNIIQYLQINTLGNALDFGDLVVTGRGQGANINSPIRGFSTGNCPYTEEIQFVKIASLGNATIFGDQIFGGGYQGGSSNSVRGVLSGGYMHDGVTLSNQKSFITMASEGNAQEFGDLTEGGDGGLAYAYNGATSVRGVVCGGLDNAASPYPSRTTVDAFNFESKGEITVIGDLSEGKRDGGMHTDSHGGLGGF
jgi:hypothetical protein